MGSAVQPQATANTPSWLQRVVVEIIPIRRDTKPQAIMNVIRLPIW